MLPRILARILSTQVASAPGRAPRGDRLLARRSLAPLGLAPLLVDPRSPLRQLLFSCFLKSTSFFGAGFSSGLGSASAAP